LQAIALPEETVLPQNESAAGKAEPAPVDPVVVEASPATANASRPDGASATTPQPTMPPLDLAQPSIESVGQQTVSDVPRAADLLTSFLPYDRATVETAIDAFLERIDGLGAGLTEFVDLGQTVPGIVAVAVVTTAASTVMITRQRRRTANQKPNSRLQAALDLFSSPSNLWKLGEI
jgi:hypothetical protein